MTATNHAITGAAIALAVRQPLLVVPLAFMSHFVLDALPHFGIYEDDVVKRNASILFRTVVSVDTLTVVILMATLPFVIHHGVAWWVILLGMFSAICPDFVWIYRFFNEIKTKQWKPGNRFVQFHQKIQWQEKPWGLSVEFVWVAVMTVTLIRI